MYEDRLHRVVLRGLGFMVKTGQASWCSVKSVAMDRKNMEGEGNLSVEKGSCLWKDIHHCSLICQAHYPSS